VRWKDGASGTFAGIDQMGHYNVMIIKERLPDGRQAVVHLEYVVRLNGAVHQWRKEPLGELSVGSGS
jgi:hypothetical protein